jgi:hypothetical protein
MQTFLLLATAALFQALPNAPRTEELRTRADSEAIVEAALDQLPPTNVVRVGRVRVEGFPWRLGLVEDSVLLGVAARRFSVGFDTAHALTQLPPCASDPSARGEQGYRIDRIVIHRESAIPAGARGQLQSVVALEYACRSADGISYATTWVRFEPRPDTARALTWKVARVDSSSGGPADRPMTFTQRHGRLVDRSSTMLFFGGIAFPLLGLLVGLIAGRRGLRWLFGAWCVVALFLAPMIGMSGFAAWVLLFLVPSGIYVSAALRGMTDASQRPALGRATAAFVIAYPLCMGVFYAWGMGVFFA